MKHLLVALNLAALSISCAHGFARKPSEPAIERCSHFADGSARCLLADGKTLVTKQPFQLENYISTNPQDLNLYDNFCHRRKE